MATKTIITRIKNKVDMLAKWQAYTGTLLDGEIAIVRVPTGDTYTNPVTGKSEPVVELLMKVGDGSTPFADLPWMSAKASDVYNWAKLSDPTAIPVTINGTPSTIGAYLAQVNANAANISSNDTDIANLSAKVDVEKVSTAISGAINALSGSTSGSGNFVKAVTQTNGQISVTMGTIAESELPNISTDKVYLAGASGTTLTAKLNTMAADIASKEGAHDHPYLSNTTKYAASSSVGGPANSANKVNKAVTFKATDGAAAGTSFDGSAAVTVSYATVGAAAASHDHDDIYYTDDEIDAKVLALNNAIAAKSDSDHVHDDRYYTETEVDNKIAAAVSSALKYKGTKETTSALPTSGNATGDVWNITKACAASGALPKVNAGDNVAWNGTGWDVLAGTVDLSNYYVKSEVNAELAKKSDTGHTHNYAGSDSEGGPANSVKAAITFSNSGSGATSGTTYNGSSAKTISYNTIGAAPATHNHTKSQITDFEHNHDERYYQQSEVDALLATKEGTHDHPYLPNTTTYAGSSTKGGAANSVANSLKVQLNGGTTEGTNQFTFNGAAAKTVNVTASAVGAYTKAEVDAELAKKQNSGNYAASSHAHGHITNDGTITTTALTSTTGVGGVVVTDSNNKVTRMSPATVRSLIGAGTSSLTLGTTATTAAAGNHTHSGYEADITAIEANYLRVNSSNKLVQHVSGTDTEIIFDCGGAE